MRSRVSEETPSSSPNTSLRRVLEPSNQEPNRCLLTIYVTSLRFLDAAYAARLHRLTRLLVGTHNALASSLVAQGGPFALEVGLRASIGYPCAAERFPLRPLPVRLRLSCFALLAGREIRFVLLSGVFLAHLGAPF